MPYFKVLIKLEYELMFNAFSGVDAAKAAREWARIVFPPAEDVEVLRVCEAAFVALDGTAKVKEG